MKKGKVKEEEPIDKIVRPIQKFAKLEASGGILLLFFTLIALIWANSPWRDSYHQLWHLHFGLTIGNQQLSKELLHWINDGLMAIFFFVVGMEIKRELVEGELSTSGQAMLPIAAALGGMLVPALLYLSFNAGKEGSAGWGIPMATDIAFAIGVVILLGNRVPSALRIFLLALAIVDDLGAVLVIALFYTADISWFYIASSVVVFFILIAANLSGIRNSFVYSVFGIILWYVVSKSGVHATIAGVLLALTIPLRSRINAAQFLERSHGILEWFRRSSNQFDAGVEREEQQLAVKTLEDTCDRVEAPLRRFEHALHPWVSFLIMPLFALANAGITFDASLFSSITHPVGLGTIIGLVFGKQIGITAFSWIAIRTGLAQLPHQVKWIQLYSVSCIGGIGFTMSLFIAGLAFDDFDFLASAKIGILAASLISAAVGSTALSMFSHSRGETKA